MKGQGRLISPLPPSILAGISVGQRVSGSTPVRQLDIRPSRMKRRCVSLLRLAPPCRFVCLAACVAASLPHEKIRGWGPTPIELGESGKDPAMLAPRPLLGLGHAVHGSAPARQSPRHRHVGHARLLAGRVHRAAPVDQAPHSGVGVAPRRGRDGLPLGEVFARPRGALVVPRRLDQQLSQALVAGLGDAAPLFCDSPLGCSEGTSPTHAVKPDAFAKR